MLKSSFSLTVFCDNVEVPSVSTVIMPDDSRVVIYKRMGSRSWKGLCFDNEEQA